jgi:hypothetical protein
MSPSSPCPHLWEAEIDPAEEAACNNDGYDYYPSYRVCARCSARQKIRYSEPRPLLDRLKDIPFTLIGMLSVLLFMAFLPLIMIIGAILSDLSSKKPPTAKKP